MLNRECIAQKRKGRVGGTASRLYTAIIARGWTEIESPTRKARCFASPVTDNRKRLFLGRKGSLRYGLVYTKSCPVPTRTKLNLLREGGAKQE